MDSLSELGTFSQGITINYNGSDDIPLLPTRESLIKDDKITEVINTYINKNQTLFFMPIDITEDNRNDYVLKIFGILMNGSKVEVNIIGIDIFFDVEVPSNIKPECIQNDLNLMLQELKIQYNIEDIYAYPLHGFKTEKQLFKRVHTNNMFNRLKLLKVVKDQMGLNTYSNDTNCYYRKAARENKLYLSDWVSLDNYDHITGPTKNSPLCEHIFTLSKNDYKHLTDPKTRSLPKIIKDRTLVMTWDIETYSGRKTGEVPMAEHDQDIVFMICMTVHWLHESNSLYKICIVDKDTESDSRWTTIICNSQTNIIKAMAICWNHFKPDIFIGFNDSGYDWPFIIEKAIRLDILEWMWSKMSAQYQLTTDNIVKRHYNDRKRKEIKITSEKTFYSQCLNVPGSISIDCLPCFMKIYPRLELNKYGTLKFYLQDNNLPTKVDLPILLMNKYYIEGNPSHMREIAYYCIVDSISVQRLFVKRNIITDYREVSTLAYVSLSDSHFYAGGIKVCNLLGAYAWDYNILVNSKPKYNYSSEKYPGAYVFPPEKGMTPNIERLKALRENPNKEEAIANFAKDRPVSCLDFASLYPSLIMTYNLSPEKIILSETEKEKYNTYDLHEINFDYGSKKIVAWSVKHNNQQEQMGLFPIILKQLFDKRKEMKSMLKKLCDKIELYELIFSKSKNYNISIQQIISEFQSEILDLSKEITVVPIGSTLEYELTVRQKRKRNIEDLLTIVRSINLDTIHQDYENICFERNCIDKKQGALKIYMNTFYGETGNKLSPYFMLQLAGGVTSAGQANIKLAANYAKSQGFGIKYGDSVMPYTPIIIKRDNEIKIVTIDSFSNMKWFTYPEFKSTESDRHSKEFILLPHLQIWTQNGWSNIRKIIRHVTTKKIYRVTTYTGLVDVTEDHSLLDINGIPIKPNDCTIGLQLLHHKPDIKYEEFSSETVAYDQLDAQKKFLILQSWHDVEIDYTDNKYILLYKKKIDNPNAIKRIELLYKSHTGYVYDIETDCGSFHAGIGNLILKNTDSLYLTCPNKHFVDCDSRYISGEYSKEDFYTAMVKISLRIIANFEQEMNEFLERDNGTKFLKMENEGCNFPCIFLGKKKYFGIQHLNEVNFKPKKIYIKGLEVIKQGKSGIEKEIGYSIIKKAVSLDNDLEIIELVKNMLMESVTSDRWKFEDFILTSSWKPTKDNKSVQSFVKRMNARHTIELKENELLIQQGLPPKTLLYTPLEPGERFNYVIVKNDILYDLQGKKVNIKVGDIMEYAHIAKQYNMQVDIIYYLIHYVIGICARFISSYEQFMPTTTLSDQLADEYSIKMAKKMLEDYIKSLSGISKKDIMEKGKECKQLFKNAVQICTSSKPTHIQEIIKGPILKITFLDDDDSEIDIIFNYASKYVKQVYKRICKDYCRDLCVLHNIDPNTGSDIGTNKSLNLYKIIKKESSNKYSILNKIEYDIRKRFNDIQINDILIKYKTDIMYIIDLIKNSNTDIYVDTDIDLTEFLKIWYDIVGLELFKLQNIMYLEYLNNLKYKRTGIIKLPHKQEINQIVDTIVNNK